ncbi:membrane protein insertase YidC [Streptomyces naganishii]|uniref:Membrane protein insertase YidC n=1 Tax=Streptomyces naganishii JCM 4654 TaxID=1306179 RepID=A0A918Y344_9ACTN|nr:membrane protein insertase YidC [Streptomyces naganishii]GHD89428.1 membrane protein [Streptomyces naganishii JCM 4654]
MSVLTHLLERLVEQLADLLQPLFHASAAAAAIVLFTALVRLLVHPLSRAAARGQRARAALQPRIAELRKKHRKDPRRLRQAVLELHAAEKVSPLSGVPASLCQLPAFFLLYHLFSRPAPSDGSGGLLGHGLFAAPLGGRWVDVLGDGQVFGAAGGVYGALFAVVALLAGLNYRRARHSTEVLPAPEGGGAAGAIARALPFMSFLTLVTVAVVPLAAALYVVTSTAWSTVERVLLYR